LRGAQDWVLQEIIALRMCAEAHQKIRRWSPEYTILRNALILSFAVHFRNVFDFLYAPDQPKEDDIIAEDFFRGPATWPTLRPQKSDFLASEKTRLHKQQAHITYERLGRSTIKATWDFSKILNELSSPLQVFYSNVDSKFLTAGTLKEFEADTWKRRIKLQSKQSSVGAFYRRILRRK